METVSTQNLLQISEIIFVQEKEEVRAGLLGRGVRDPVPRSSGRSKSLSRRPDLLHEHQILFRGLPEQSRTGTDDTARWQARPGSVVSSGAKVLPGADVKEPFFDDVIKLFSEEISIFPKLRITKLGLILYLFEKYCSRSRLFCLN